jgi:glycosyltransferase involved in cell wall biosynthesis
MILPYEFHLPNGWDPSERNNGTVLIISHEFSRTGAPIVAATAAKILKENGYFVIVASFREEPVMDDILSDGIPVLIDQSISDYRRRLPKDVPPSISPSIGFIIHDFDLVFVNTFVCHNIINCYNGTNVPLLWWLHEGYASFVDGNARFMPTSLGNNVRVLTGGKYVQKVLKDVGINYTTDSMLYGVEDCSSPSREKLQEKVRFIFPGSFEKRKNHKVLFEAIQNLTPESKANSEFICIGIYWEQNFYNDLKMEAKKINNLTLLDPIPYEDLMDLYDTCDCIVVPSIDDPMPVVLAEGMMLSKIVVSSNMTGTAQYIEDGINGFVFDCNNSEELSEKLEFIIKHRNQLDCVKQAGRKVFEELFSINAFEKQLLTEVKKSLNKGDC